MSEFLFNRSQRVTMPVDIAGAEGVQGVIVANTGFIGREPEYRIQSLVTDKVAESGALIVVERNVSESALVAAQPPKMISLADADAMASKAFFQGGNDVRSEIEAERQSRLAKRKASRKAPARKRTRK